MTVQSPPEIEPSLRRTYQLNSATIKLQFRRPVAVAVAVWILSMISLPIARWTWGDSVIPVFSTISVVVQCAAVVLILWEGWGGKSTVCTFAVVAIFTWGAEWFGSTTGFPFGRYHYTGLLQPQLSGVPLLIPLAWFMMLVPSWAIAHTVLDKRFEGLNRLVALAALSGVSMTAWDLYLDPQMVGWNFWVWDSPGAYFGIPLVNFLGWFAVATLVTLVVRPRAVPRGPLVLIYGVVWAFQAVGMALFWGLPGPALFGFSAMGLMLALTLLRVGRTLWTP